MRRTIGAMIDQTTTYTVELGFLPPDAAIPDAEHPGLLRAGDRATAPYGREGVEVHRCLATDLLDYELTSISRRVRHRRSRR